MIDHHAKAAECLNTRKLQAKPSNYSTPYFARHGTSPAYQAAMHVAKTHAPEQEKFSLLLRFAFGFSCPKNRDTSTYILIITSPKSFTSKRGLLVLLDLCLGSRVADLRALDFWYLWAPRNPQQEDWEQKP